MSLLQFNNELGIILPSTEEIRADIGAKIQAAFQTKASDPVLNIEPSSPMGQVLDLLVAEIEAKNAEIIAIANMADPNTAQGRFLDALAALYGLKRKISEPTIVNCVCTGLKGTVIPYGAIAQDGEGNQFRCVSLGGARILESGSVTADFAAIEHGALEISANSVTNIVTAVAGWDSVNNPTAGAVGRDEETDAELRNRMAQSYAYNATGYVEAIRANLANLDGVIDCVVRENYTNDAVTIYGYSVAGHSIVVGIVGGDDDDIAEVIYRRKDAGCGTIGNYSVSYTDSENSDNVTYSYKIIRPTGGAFKIKVTAVATSISDTLIAAIKDALIADFLGGGSNPRIGMCQTIYASRFYAVVQSVTTVPIRLIEVALNSGSFGQTVDIPITTEPTLSDSDITIELAS